MEFFSHEHGRTVEYNPLTGETRGMEEPNQSTLETSLEGRFTSNLERTRELVEPYEPNQTTSEVPLERPTPSSERARGFVERSTSEYNI